MHDRLLHELNAKGLINVTELGRVIDDKAQQSEKASLPIDFIP